MDWGRAIAAGAIGAVTGALMAALAAFGPDAAMLLGSLIQGISSGISYVTDTLMSGHSINWFTLAGKVGMGLTAGMHAGLATGIKAGLKGVLGAGISATASSIIGSIDSSLGGKIGKAQVTSDHKSVACYS